MSHGEDWERTYTEGNLWSAQPGVAQPWALTSYTSHPSPHVVPDDAQTSNGALQSYPYPMQTQFSASGVLQLQRFVSDLDEQIKTVPFNDKRTQDEDEDEDSSGEDCDWDKEYQTPINLEVNRQDPEPELDHLAPMSPNSPCQ
jgi:hypothetical protein